MKWKTSTIITILLISIGVVGFTLFEKDKSIKEFEAKMEVMVEEQVKLKKEEIAKKYEERLNICEKRSENLKEELEEVIEKVRYIRQGGENEFYINQIKSNSKKTVEKLKIRRGEVFKHIKSEIVVYLKREGYEDQVFLNLTLPNKETEERDWQTGKYYYYWNASRNGLSQVLPTFIGDKSIEVEWTYFKANSDFDISSKN